MFVKELFLFGDVKVFRNKVRAFTVCKSTFAVILTKLKQKKKKDNNDNNDRRTFHALEVK